MLASYQQFSVPLVYEKQHWYPVLIVALALMQRSTRSLLMATTCGFALQSSIRKKAKVAHVGTFSTVIATHQG